MQSEMIVVKINIIIRHKIFGLTILLVKTEITRTTTGVIEFLVFIHLKRWEH